MRIYVSVLWKISECSDRVRLLGFAHLLSLHQDRLLQVRALA
jgi:hypothetical protein